MKLKNFDLDPDTRLNRKDLAAALEARGLTISTATLARRASRGEGPPYTLFCGRAVYRWEDALAWAAATLAKPRLTSEVV
jgi:hypothetical protein